MRRQLLASISVAALSVVSYQLSAAELEPAAPQERAAPAAERPAPAAQRERQAAPARRAQPTRQASTQPSQSSWTGSQVGGFGGGGGGASDPPFVTSQGACNGTATAFVSGRSGGLGISSPSSTQTVACVPGPGIHSNLPMQTGAVGAIAFDTPKFPVPLGIPMLFGGPRTSVLLIGGVVDVGTGTRSSDSTQFNSYSTSSGIGPDAAGTMTNETIHVSFREKVSAGFRAKIGLPVYNYWAMPYITAGVAVARTEADYSYNATNFALGCTPGAGCATNVVGAGSFNQTRSGFIGGGGLEVLTGIPNVILAFDYTYMNLGSISQTIPLVTTNCAAAGGIACTNSADQVRFSNLTMQRFTVGVKIGL